MKALIVDDNENARIALRSDLEDYCLQVQIIGEAEGVAEAYSLANSLNPELIFLDIRMGDGTGFDFLEKFPSVEGLPFKVIFTTAYDEFALKAFKYAAVDYLLKPIDAESLESAVARVEKLLQTDTQQRLNDLLSFMKKPTSSKLTLADADRIHIVPIQDIIRCESDKNYTTFFLAEGQKITVSKTIKEYDEQLARHLFYRVHHSHLVNLNQIKEVIKTGGTYLLMKDGSSVPVSTRKKDALIQKMKELW